MSNRFQVISPVNGTVYVEREMASEEHVESSLAAAIKAQKKWRQTSMAERLAICTKAVSYFVENAYEIGEELTWQMGRPIQYAPYEILKGFQERAKYMIAMAESSLADIKIPASDGFQKFIRKDPVGVVMVLAPWNYPYLTSVNAVIPALMAGNAVILKHAQQTPLCAERYAKAFEYAGLPKGVFQFLHLTHGQVAQVISDQRIAYVAFTGSVEGGHAVQQAISKRFIGAGLELGGKDPAYVRSDADINNAIENLVDGAFFNSGQSCCGIERIYVHKDVYEDFVSGFVAMAKGYQLEDPLLPGTTLGPMVKTSAAILARKQVEEAIQKGASALIDPISFPRDEQDSPYMAPQVLVNVDHSMAVMTEESFAPIVGLMSVESDEEAIRLMNDSRYGLTASIWTKDEARAISLGDQVETGTFFLNRCDYLDPTLPWTGVKDSGRGVTLSGLGYDYLTRPKSFHLKLGV